LYTLDRLGFLLPGPPCLQERETTQLDKHHHDLLFLLLGSVIGTTIRLVQKPFHQENSRIMLFNDDRDLLCMLGSHVDRAAKIRTWMGGLEDEVRNCFYDI
jgi:hypothetical protein